MAAVSGAVVKTLMDQLRNGDFNSFEPMFPTSFSAKSFTSIELAAFVVLGLLMGLIGPMYIRMRDFFKSSTYKFSHNHPVAFVLTISMIIGLCSYFPGAYNRQLYSDIIRDLCSPETLDAKWQQHSIYFALALCAITRIAVDVPKKGR